MWNTLFIILIILFLLYLITQTAWFRRKARQKTEDFIRSATGMPPRPGTRKRKKYDREREEAYQKQNEYYQRERRRRNSSGRKEPIIPVEYAEDVEFTETIDYSSDAIPPELPHSQKEYHEKQVSDVEWVEIKIKK